MEEPQTPKLSTRRIILIVSGVLAIACIFCVIAVTIYNATPAGKASQTADAQTKTAQPTKTLRPSVTTVPTKTATSTLMNTPAPTTSPTATQIATITAAPKATFTMLEYTEIVAAGGHARANIQTTPGAACSISYITPGNNLSEAEGLKDKIADASGVCFWEWEISPGTEPGEGEITITVSDYSQIFPITITNP